MKKYIIALIITILFLSSPAYALHRQTDFIGGCTYCLDVIDGARLTAKTKPVYAIVSTTPEHATYPSKDFAYLWDSDAGCSESVPDSIIPDLNAAGGCWILLTPGQAADIVADSVKDTHIDWGTGANQVSAVDVPIADAGSLITGTEVEAALQENRGLINTNTAASHAESHTVVSHSDTTATGTELETLTDTSDASGLHNHTTANLNDTTATGANLNTLTDDSMADALHRQSELSSPDGTQNQVVTVDNSGNTDISGDFGVTGTTELDKAVYINGQPLSAKAVKIQSTGNTVLVNGYDKEPAGGVTSGEISPDSYMVTGGTYNEWLLNNSQLMIRENAEALQVVFYACSSTGTITYTNCTNQGNWGNVTDLYINIWRYEAETGTTSKLIGSVNMCSGANDCVTDGEVIPGEINTKTISISGMQAGDIASIGLQKDGANKYTQFALWNYTNGDCRMATSTPATTGYDWFAQGQCQGAGTYFPIIQIYGTSPVNIAVGDSIGAGLGLSSCAFGECRDKSFLQNSDLKRNQADYDWLWQLSEMLGGETYQNMSIGGNTSTHVLARFQADVVDMSPRRVILQIGTNDTASSVALATYQSNMTAMLELSKTNNIMPVINLIPPYQAWSLVTIQEMVLRVLANDWLKDTLAPSYNAVVVDIGAVVGIKFDLQSANQWAGATPYSLNTPVSGLAADVGSWFYVSSISGTGTSGGAEPTWCLQKGCTVTDNAGANQIIWTNGGPSNNDWTIASWADVGDGVHLSKAGYAAYARAVYNAITGGRTPYDVAVSSFPNGSTYGNITSQSDFTPLAIMLTPSTTALGTANQVIDFSALDSNTQRTGYDNANTDGYGCDVSQGYCTPTLPGDYVINAQVTISTGLADQESAQLILVKDNPFHGEHDAVAGASGLAHFCDKNDADLSVTEGISDGMTIYNITDGSSGTVTLANGAGGAGDCEVGTNNKITTILAGGVDNDFDDADHIMIIDADCGGSNATQLTGDQVIAAKANTPVTLRVNKTVTMNGIDDWLILCGKSESASTIDNGADNTFFEIIKVGD